MKKITLLLLSIMTMTVLAADFLMPDQAFKPHATLNQEMEIEASVEIAENIYLYADKMGLEITSDNGVTVKNITSPESVEHHEEQSYLESPAFIVELQRDAAISGTQTVAFKLSYQGCSEDGLCYEPLSKEYTFEVDTLALSIAEKNAEVKTLAKADEKVVEDVELSQTDAIADAIKSGGIALTLFTFFGFGLLLAMTPCVFPMIPIISGLIISQGEGLTTRKAFMLSLVYVLAMAVAYTIAGVLAGLFGANLQAALQTPWVIYSFSFVFVALAFSMFGFYELKLPDSFVTKISSASHGSGYIGVAIMGFLSALIVGPCVAAPLAGALVYIGQTGDAVLGGMALFAMSIGMGVPLIVVGVSAGKFMPKPGAWMTMVSAIFGVMMLGVAIWMLEKIVEPEVTILLYGFLGIGFALYLGAFDREGHIFKRSVAMIMFIYSVALFIGVMAGSANMLKPLAFLKPQVVNTTTQTDSEELDFKVVKSIAELDVVLQENIGKKILLDFSAEWCVACKELEEITFVDKDVKTKMGEFILVRADVTDNGEKEKALNKKYGVFGPPVMIFFDEESNVQKSKTVVGFIEPKPFLEHLNKL
ncbi:MAG: protein-disulfide reductase DsbD [Campylobacterota bacterium]|nr:protein-disulfide reductase DsbD [Campylobacterota bacterium]